MLCSILYAFELFKVVQNVVNTILTLIIRTQFISAVPTNRKSEKIKIRVFKNK